MMKQYGLNIKKIILICLNINDLDCGLASFRESGFVQQMISYIRKFLDKRTNKDDPMKTWSFWVVNLTAPLILLIIGTCMNYQTNSKIAKINLIKPHVKATCELSTGKPTPKELLEIRDVNNTGEKASIDADVPDPFVNMKVSNIGQGPDEDLIVYLKFYDSNKIKAIKKIKTNPSYMLVTEKRKSDDELFLNVKKFPGKYSLHYKVYLKDIITKKPLIEVETHFGLWDSEILEISKIIRPERIIALIFSPKEACAMGNRLKEPKKDSKNRSWSDTDIDSGFGGDGDGEGVNRPCCSNQAAIICSVR
ncbi:hypothetical protein [Desulfobacula sp.]|uniref:hypothetical protein n=1 Tax=Desulfobacula sp. TaxID=2593537 RepID=UPI00263436D1|nr:hypothetical protein [Desulfobacula sp.]